MEDLVSNTGTVSFLLYGLFIAITIAAVSIAIYSVANDVIQAEKLDKMIDLFKYAIVTVAIATTTLIVTNLFKEREQDVKELEYFDRYVQDVKKADNIVERLKLSRYLSIVAPSGAMKRSWGAYYEEVAKEYSEYLKAKLLQTQQQQIDSVLPPRTIQQLANEQAISAGESPLSSAPPSTITRPDRFIINTSADPISAAQYEQQGFILLATENYSAAASAFMRSENAQNGFRNSYELAQLLRRNALKMQSDKKVRDAVLAEIKDKYTSTAPPEVKEWLKKQAQN